MNYYANLGAVPAVALRANEARDALLSHTGPAARVLLHQIGRLPRARRIPELNRVLMEFEPGLPARLQRTVEFLHREGMPVDAAMERGLALSLADGSIERFKQIGRKTQQGRMFPVGGLGASGDSAGDVVGNMLTGIACSERVSSATTELVGRKEGADAAGATEIGFAVVRGAAPCPGGTISEPPYTPPSETSSSPLVPVLLGVGAIAAVGGVVWAVTRKK